MGSAVELVKNAENMPYDVIALGETMVALAARPGESLRDAATWAVDHAGAESNTCVGLARLGFRVAWVSRIGTDAGGERILDALATEGVDTRWVRRDPDRVTGLMVKDPNAGVRYYRTGSAASTLSPGDLDGVPVSDARAVLVSGVTALIGAQPQAAGLALLESARGLRIVDPNLRSGLWGSHRRAELVRPFVARCDLLLAGSQELAELLGGDANDLNALAERAAVLGSSRTEGERREVVVRGASAIGVRAPDGAWQVLGIQRGEPIDPIGAGDAFNAGYIAVRLRNGTVEEALRAGARCGAAVTSAISDTSAFPRTLR
jgi:2-dehydro-3-deoxygluconokinase